MDQIITLLSNLFNLTKVASVTLPGLALAGALALFLWPPHAIDIVRIPAIIPIPSLLSEAEMPCSDLPVLESGQPANCNPHASLQDSGQACVLNSIYLNDFNREENFTDTAPLPVIELCRMRANDKAQSDSSQEPRDAKGDELPQQDAKLRENVTSWCHENFPSGHVAPDFKRKIHDSVRAARAEQISGQVCAALTTTDAEHMKIFREKLDSFCNANTRLWLPNWPFSDDESLALVNLTSRKSPRAQITIIDVLGTLEALQVIASDSGRFPWRANVVKQFVLDKTKDRLMSCTLLETAWLGQEQADNDQLKADIANIDKQRSDLQDVYLASLKTNDRVITDNFRRKLSGVLNLANQYRARSAINLASINERSRRLDDIKQEQTNLIAILAEPGSIRALQGFDVYIQGLVNHVVGFILLAIALSIVLVAFDRTVLGNLFEDVFPGW